MKIHYIGILKNETKPAHELCAEKDLTAYSRFTRNKYARLAIQPPCSNTTEDVADKNPTAMANS
ncbi:hypothetical protein LSUB1_G003300 [Lachnellula subtilissima]|uniref:Uncharacterized protein n=1 Tax=Lachnellula subtilissima TaxID=602034 RepID=A0A8H8RV57_9HELO|nr:hypothetical protein LSUB1_G003300 [Lachnellula subtilissima]